MNDSDIALFLMANEPAFELGGKQYSVCCPANDLFSTWDSEGNVFDFHGVTELLDRWEVDGKLFREVVPSLM